MTHKWSTKQSPRWQSECIRCGLTVRVEKGPQGGCVEIVRAIGTTEWRTLGRGEKRPKCTGGTT